MKLWKINRTVFLLSLFITLIGCNDVDDIIIGVPNITPESIAPGELLPWNTKVRINNSGTYLLPIGATLLNTRCFGKVTVSFDLPSGESQSNTCHNTAGNSSQTNIVKGVATVFYSIQSESHADVTVQ